MTAALALWIVTLLLAAWPLLGIVAVFVTLFDAVGRPSADTPCHPATFNDIEAPGSVREALGSVGWRRERPLARKLARKTAPTTATAYDIPRPIPAHSARVRPGPRASAPPMCVSIGDMKRF